MKKVVSLLLVIAIATLMLIPVYADLSDEKSYVEAAEVSGSWTYTVKNNEATITAYGGTETEIEIPSELDGYTVTAIQNTKSSSVFSNSSTLRSVVIPDSIKSIGKYAFSRCSSLESVTLPSSLVSIGDYAFRGCSALASLSLPNTLETIGKYAFSNCTGLTEISLPENLTTIGERAFYRSDQITSLTIPASVNSIGEAAFVCRNLNEISVAGENNAYCADGNILYSADMTKMLIYAAGNKAEEFEIPAGVTEVGAYTFYYCDSLKNIRIPSSVSSIDPTNFYTCANLENIYVDKASESFTDIDGILYDKTVTKLISRPSNNAAVDLVIPDTVTTVGDYALIDISNVVTITIPASVTSTSSFAFDLSEHNNITDIYYGGSKDSWDKLWKSIGGSYYTTADVFPNAEMHYELGDTPTQPPSPIQTPKKTPAPTQTPAPTPGPTHTPAPTHTPGPTAAPVKWRISNFNEENGRINIVVGSGTTKGTPYTIIAAKYKGDALIDAVIDNSVTDVEGGIGQSVYLSRKLATNEGEYVKIMLWDGTASCKPLCEPYIGNLKIAAFPGAEGAGKYSTGARGAFRTEVYHVTNLNDSGEGSFRDAVSKQGRIVVFDVGGTINLTKRVDIASAITILGQTAPGDGITLTGANVVASGGGQIIRYLRIRPTDVNGLEADAFGGNTVSSIIDHCSTSYSVDECLTFYGCANTTVQNCISSESLKASIHGKGNHGYGGIWGGTNSSYHHNLMATHDSRTPRLDRQLQGTDVRNNIIYNWGNTNSAYGGESVSTDGSYLENDTKVNWVNNYYKAGAATASKLRTRLFDTSSPKEYPSYFYFRGNVLEGNAEVTADNTKGVRINSDKGMVFLDEPVEMEIDIPEESAEETYNTLLSHVGASLPRRDETDARVINDVINGTGRIIDSASEVGGVMQYKSTRRVFEIPQEWKDANGMGDSADTNIVPFGKWIGYTWIEAYVNEWTEQQENPTNPTVTVKVDKTSAAAQNTVSVSAGAVPQSGTEIVKIDIYDNDVLVSTHTGANVASSIQLGTAGTHYISAVAYNDKGESTRSTPTKITVTALN